VKVQASNFQKVNPVKKSELREKFIIFGSVALVLGIIYLTVPKK